ncbi:MAG: hypothetical protein H7833_09780 [Magnetococcus sp. DMHC-1]
MAIFPGLTVPVERWARLLERCRTEQDPTRLKEHCVALEKFFLEFVAPQSALYHQQAGSTIPDETLDEALVSRLVTAGAGCLGESHRLLCRLHAILHQSDPAGFHQEATRLIERLDRILRRVQGG